MSMLNVADAQTVRISAQLVMTEQALAQAQAQIDGLQKKNAELEERLTAMKPPVKKQPETD